MSAFQITRMVKAGGPLTKRIMLQPDGTTKSDGSACLMANGEAHRVHLESVADLADLIASLELHEAIALGALRPDLPEKVPLVTKRRLEKLNGGAQPDVVARTGDHICYRLGEPAFALLDYDAKGMPDAVCCRLSELGGFAQAVRSVLPDLAHAARALRMSTSAGLYRTDTGERFASSGGMHLFVAVADGADIPRFLDVLHARCWLAGLGWMMTGAAGQLLERSIVDRMVGAPERLVFEGAPIVDPPLAQDAASRLPQAKDGPPLDTIASCPPLTILEQSRLKELRAREAHRLAPDSAKVRDAFIDQQADKIAKRAGINRQQAVRVVERQCAGVLLPHFAPAWDDAEMGEATVADVLADPGRFEGATLADPLEGIGYGSCKAKIMRRSDGTPWIHSFAHGRTTYELLHDARAIEAALGRVDSDHAADTLISMAMHADLDEGEAEELRDLTAKRAGIGKRPLDARLKRSRKEQAQRRAAEDRERGIAERCDPRPQVPAPEDDAPWLPQMQALNDVLGASRAPEPPTRDIDGAFVQVRVRRIPNMHALTAASANEGDTTESRLPAAEQPLLTRLNPDQLAELIERHIDYTDVRGRSVHLAAPFVRHYLDRSDDALPIVAAIATLPLVLPDGTIMAGRGLLRERGIVFRIPEELMAQLPAQEDCDDDAVAAALAFLTDQWLCDVAADFTGKCILIAAALTLIERSLLPDRPVFFVTAGRRGGGKTTTLIMLLMAITGGRPAAAAWSPNEEERRKSLLAYLMEALPAIIWDNIPRGSQISCPHIERSCTTAFYSDRRLGVSELVAVAAAVVHLFTGNNIAPRGDLASRALTARLEIDRSDPENRPFTHPDPIAWTEAHRGKILRALYTLLLGNPALRSGSNAPAKTRFKLWWRLVGSAIEHAASVSGACLDFKDLFLAQEEDEEEGASLADALAAMADTKWPQADGSPKATGPFQAAHMARMVSDQSEYRLDDERERAAIVREFLFPTAPPGQIITAKAVGKRLKRHIGEPIKRGDTTLILKEWRDPHGGPKGASSYYVQAS